MVDASNQHEGPGELEIEHLDVHLSKEHSVAKVSIFTRMSSLNYMGLTVQKLLF
jgi:hypothetical protein